MTEPSDETVTLLVLDSGATYFLPAPAFGPLVAAWGSGLDFTIRTEQIMGGGDVAFKNESIHHIVLSTPGSREFADLIGGVVELDSVEAATEEPD